MRNGLNSNNVSSVLKDKNGLIWVGTQQGLYIFDGYTFTAFEGVLSAASIQVLTQREGDTVLFAGTEKGLFCINPHTMTARQVYSASSKIKSSWTRQQVNAICVKPGQKELYALLGRNTIARINADNELEKIGSMRTDSIEIKKILLRNKSNLILIGKGRSYNYDLNLDKLTSMFSGLPLETAFLFDSTLVLLSEWNGIYLANMPAQKLQILPHLKQRTQRLITRNTKAIVKNNKLYFSGSNYSFYIYDLSTNHIVDITQRYRYLFEGKICNDLWIDEHNVLWLATNKGLIKIVLPNPAFGRTLHYFPKRVSTRNIIEMPSGDLYVGSYAGLWYKKAHQQKWINYRVRNLLTAIDSLSDPTGISATVALLADTTAGFIYVGFDAYTSRLIRFNIVKHIFEFFPYKKLLNGRSFMVISTLLRHQDIIWIGTNRGLASYDITSSVFTMHVNDPFDLGDHDVLFLYQKPKEKYIYAGTNNGLYVIDPGSGILRRYSIDTKPALSSKYLGCINNDTEGNLWLGTYEGGINVIAAHGESVKTIQKQQGLSSNTVCAIMQEDSNTLWISTFNGLNRYDIKRKTFTNYFEEDGLTSDEFNKNSFLKTKNGEFLLGSINGIVSFDPKHVIPPTSFSIRATGISYWNDQKKTMVVERRLIDSNEVIVKKPTERFLEIHLACTDYFDPLRNQFYYRIKGTHTWIPLDYRHSINLASLPYGNYRIEVKAVNAHGTPASQNLLLKVNVMQPFVKTGWFYALLSLIVISILYIAYWIKSSKFKQILHLRMKISSNLHDEVGSLLTRITLFGDLLLHGQNTEDQKKDKLEGIVELSRTAISSMSDVLWAIDSRNDFIGNLLDRMREYTEHMLSPQNIDVNFMVSQADSNLAIASSTRQEIYLLYKEAIHNIVKHSMAQNVDIIFTISKKSFFLRIQNDGVVVAPAPYPSGQGLDNISIRAKRLQAHLTISNKDGKFTLEINKP